MPLCPSLLVAATISCLLAAATAPAGEAVVSILDHGAKPDGKTLATAAIQKAIDACAAKGGGTVRIPKGTFLSGTLTLRNGITLTLDEGATLLGSRNRDDYSRPNPADPARRVFRSLLDGRELHDIAITGKGTIDGSGDAFRDRKKHRPKCIYLVRCRNVLIDGVRMRAAGSWMQHYRQCRDLTIRNIDVFNHVSYNNDGMNIDACHDVSITGCRVDSDDDGIVLKSLSAVPCRNVTIADCVVSSHCNALKLGTESGGGFIDITISRCKVFSPKRSQKIYGRQRGLAGIALEIVDGGTMENVSVSDVDIEGVSVPIFVRLGNRARRYGRPEKPGVGTLRKVSIRNITARHTSLVGCSITGLPGHPVRDVVLENIRLGFEGGGTLNDTKRTIPEKAGRYPESTMFGTLPAWGFYCRHVRGITFKNLALTTDTPDLRHAMVFDDVEGLTLDGLDAAFAPGAAPLLRLTDVRQAILRGCSPKAPVDTLLRIEGKATHHITLEASDLTHVRQPVAFGPGVAKAVFTRK